MITCFSTTVYLVLLVLFLWKIYWLWVHVCISTVCMLTNYELQTYETHSNILHRPHQATGRKGQHPFFLFLVYITKQKKTTHIFPFTKLI